MALAPGTNLGVYKILHPLGSGGMGEVYCALDAKLARRVAIKVLPESLAANSDSLARFEREARALAALQHPGILAVHDFGREGEFLFTVTELLEGRTLRDKLRKGPLPIERAIQIGIELASALTAAHEKGIIHRDLKPGNIFILKDGRMKLLDFGLAKQVSLPALVSSVRDHSTERLPTGGDTEPGLLLGTAGYMAPEQIRGKSLDARTDIFAFGCLFFEMCVGRKLFQRENLVDTLHAILSEDPVLADPNLPPRLEYLIRRCLEKEPEKRFQSALDLSYSLESHQGMPLVPGGEARRGPRRWALALGGALLIAGGAYTRSLLVPAVAQPSFRPLTTRHGEVKSARFTPEGGRIVFSAVWGSERQRLFIGTAGSSQDQPIGEPGSCLFAVSPKGELGIGQVLRPHPTQGDRLIGRLVRQSLAGGPSQPLGEGICAADWDPSGGEIAVVRRVEGKDRVEYPLGHTLDEGTGWISNLRFDPTGRHLAFLDHPRAGEGGGSVVSIEVATGQRRTLSEGWANLCGMAWGPGGDEVWYTAGRAGEPRALRRATLRGQDRLVYMAPSDLTLQDVSRSGAMLLCQEDRFVGAIGKTLGQEPTLLPIERDHRVEGISGDGTWMLVSGTPKVAASGRSMALCDLRSGESKGMGIAAACAVSPLGDRIAMLNLEAGQYRLVIRRRLDGSELPIPIEGFASLRGMVWHPDGRSLFLCGTAGSDAHRIWRVGLDPVAPPQPITSEGVDPERPFRISPDGQRLVMALGPVVYRMDLNPGDTPRPIPELAPSDRILGFQDGGHLLLASSLTLPVQLESFDLASGRRRGSYVIPDLGHEGAQLDRGFQLAGSGSAYAGGFTEVRSTLFLLEWK